MRRDDGWSSGPPFPPNDRGSSVLEALVTVLLLSALGLALWSGVSAGVRLGNRVLRDTVQAARMVRFDRLIRQEARRVRTPFWEAGPVEDTGPGWLRVSWVDGEPAEGLTLERRERLLVVRVRQAPPLVFGPFAQLDFGLYRDTAGQARGLRVSVVAPGGDADDPQVIVAPFGGSPISIGGGP